MSCSNWKAYTALHIKEFKLPLSLLSKVGHTFTLEKHCPSLRLFEELLTPKGLISKVNSICIKNVALTHLHSKCQPLKEKKGKMMCVTMSEKKTAITDKHCLQNVLILAV